MVVVAIADAIEKSMEFKNRESLLRNWANDLNKSQIKIQASVPLNNSALTTTQKLREEGKMLKFKEKVESRKDMFVTGLNRPGYAHIKDCGYLLLVSYFFTQIADVIAIIKTM